MTCFRAKPAWKNHDPNPSGEYGIGFNFRTRTPDYFIDCGRCEGCRARQKRDWAIRMAHEATLYERNCFVTLTYDDEHLPDELVKSDIQVFIKRLRHHSKRPIRYYAVGEYGEKTNRPHYHAIIFNEDFLGGAYDINDKLYGNKILDGIWKQGNTAISEFTFATALYTAGYTVKKISAPDTFSLMSRTPPIGRGWLQRNHDNLRRNKSVVVNGTQYPIPKAYMNWLKGDETFRAIKEELAEKVQPLNNQQAKNRRLNFNAQQGLKTEKI